ncbi:MAG: sulfatase [Acidobacteria bacterium]|nr:MAG: sulfatase [Acidobacteriota bacterium]
MNLEHFKRIQTRRHFFQECVGGLGAIALWNLLEREGRSATSVEGLPKVNPLAPKPPHFAPKAKNVIFLYMEGAPSHIDLFDPKPEMKKWDGQPLPEAMTKDLKLAFIKRNAKVWASPRVFQRFGQCGMEFSDYLPHLATCADDICMVRSMFTEQFNHHPGQLMFNCGTPLVGRPSMGAWVTYGLGSESQSLPGFVVLSSGTGTSAGSGNWSSGFLPSTYQGVTFRNSGDPVLYLSNPGGVSLKSQRAALDAIRDLNQQSYVNTGDLEIASRIASYELAFRMQAAAPELLDFSKESPNTLEMYGVDKEPTKPFATNCLLARRMIERGVRFVQLFHASWDDHTELNAHLKKNCEITDQPAAALLKDLKQRGLLDTTLVIWGSEFGRTPLVESRNPAKGSEGRDHHPFAFSIWMAGGGIKGGQVIGKTDEFGLNIVEDKIHVHDLQATILHCLGLNHEKLTYRHQGRDFRLTDVEGKLVQKLLA